MKKLKSPRARAAYSMARMGRSYQYIGDILGVCRQRAYQMAKSQERHFGPLPKWRNRNAVIF